MYEVDEKKRIYFPVSHVSHLKEMVGCRMAAVHRGGTLPGREGIIAHVQYHARARLWEIAFRDDVPTLNLLGNEWTSYQFRVFDERVVCRYCGAYAHTFFQEPIGERLRKYRVCYECDAWLTRLGDLWLEASHALAERGLPFFPERFRAMLPKIKEA